MRQSRAAFCVPLAPRVHAITVCAAAHAAPQSRRLCRLCRSIAAHSFAWTVLLRTVWTLTTLDTARDPNRRRRRRRLRERTVFVRGARSLVVFVCASAASKNMSLALVHPYIRAAVERLSVALIVVQAVCNRLKMFLVDYLFNASGQPQKSTQQQQHTAGRARRAISRSSSSDSFTDLSMSKARETRCIVINHEQHADSQLFRLKRGTVLHIVPGASLMGRRVAVYSNLPVNDKADFLREQYLHVNWFNASGKRVTSEDEPYAEITNVDIYCELELNRAGAFHFYFAYQPADSNGVALAAGDKKLPKHATKAEPIRRGSIYVQVEPTIRVGGGEEQPRRTIALDAIRCQTVLAKCLGPLSTWESKLAVAKHAGYNMVHFTPVQELGGSNSAYSIQDQRKVNPTFADPARPVEPTFADVERVVQKMRTDWGIASICDIVLNHTANESKWIYEQPDASYSATTTPHLKPAILLDAMFALVSADVAAGLLEPCGVPTVIDCEDHVQALKWQLHTTYLPKVNVYEFYQLDVEAYMKRFSDKMRNGTPPSDRSGHPADVCLIQDPLYKRLGCTVDFDAAFAAFNTFRQDCFDEDTRLRKCAESFRAHLEHLNQVVRHELDEYLGNAVDNCLAGLRYERIQSDGPKVRVISKQYPLFTPYFTDGGLKGRPLADIELAMHSLAGAQMMAHNGWVMSADPLADFARAPQSGRGNVYLKRELIAWGDSVKLRFGDRPADSPFLWQFFKEYVQQTARIFDGIRLDNCHSTPLHVAEYMLDAAREVNPELYVAAELFTNSDQTDNIFVNRLGITSLIREAQSAWDSHEEGRLVYRYGGAPVGAFYNSTERAVAPSIAHALFLDLTHDNPSPIEKRSVFDMLPTAALVSMACCATGSNRGYDELVPHHIHVVNEARQYQEWNNGVDAKTGLIGARRALNALHGRLADEGFDQVYVDQMSPDVVAVTRHSPGTHQSVILVAHTAFANPDPNAGPTGVRSLRFEGTLEEIILEADLTHKCFSLINFFSSSGKPFDRPYNYKPNDKFINGLTEYELRLSENIALEKSNVFRRGITQDGHVTQLDFENLRPGTVVAIRVSLSKSVRPHFEKLDELKVAFASESGPKYAELLEIVSRLDLIDLNRAIFRCDTEERDMGNGTGVYDVPGYGPLVYCGSQGFVSVLTEIAPNNDLGHPFCNNLREGNWMIDYIHNRLAKNTGTTALADWVRTNVQPLYEIPRYLIPSYFDVIVRGLHKLLTQQCVNLMPDFVRKGSSYTKLVAIGSLQFIAVSDSAALPALSPHIRLPLPAARCPTLSAGLPHFSTGYMRCWGRDTFIALRGLLLLTGRYDEARYIILGFGACLRHGLIPNLLDNGTNPRFNCRDAIWWWLYSVQQYVQEAPNGAAILTEKVSRLFPNDDSPAQPAGKYEQLLHEVIQEALLVHFQGLAYRERNAGHQIDEHMRDNGFNNQIGINPNTGFVFGGNADNCGTWMDKMGSSDAAGNRGVPTTPRDGSAIELIGLQMSTLRFLQRLAEQKQIPYKSVERIGKAGDKTVWTYGQWADLIAQNFEAHCFVPDAAAPLVNKRCIYKDTVGASKPWADFQLRCNFPIAMVAAPEMFDARHAWQALEQARKHLLGPLGMKTLDPDDWEYRGFYDNSNDSDDAKISHGANYHQGPEWVWPIGFFLRARLIFAAKNNCLKETIAETWTILIAHLKELQTSHWRGLPELTNENGSYCVDSCRTQAWSMSAILEVLYDLQQLENFAVCC